MLRKLIVFFSNTNQSISYYIVKVSLFTSFIGFVIAYTLGYFFADSPTPSIELSIVTIFGIVILSPITETLFMIPILFFLKKVTRNIFIIALLSAFFWSCLHSIQNPLWGLGVFCLFYILSLAYLYWEKHSVENALIVVMLIHSINNTSVLFFVFFENIIHGLVKVI